MEEDQQFCLRWNNHQSTLISVFDTLLENGTLVDCTLAAEGKFLKAHKVVLSACSPYFATLLSQQYDKHPIFILKDVKFQELRAMMDYMYRGEVNISQDQLGALLKAAESLQIKGLSENRSNSNSTQKNDAKHQIPVTKSGLTIEQKRPFKHNIPDIDSDIGGSREGSTSPTSRKRKKVRRRSTEALLTDNHDHLSNSSSQSLPHIASTSGSINNLPTSVVNVTTKTELLQQHIDITAKNLEQAPEENDQELNEPDDEITPLKNDSTDIVQDKVKDTEMLLEPKNEYDDNQEENVEDLTLEDEDMLEDLDHAGPSHSGEGSSQGYSQWQVERTTEEPFVSTQESGGAQRDSQANNKSTVKYVLKNSLTRKNLSLFNKSSPSSSLTGSVNEQLVTGMVSGNKIKEMNSFKNSNHPRIKYSLPKNKSYPNISFNNPSITSSSSSILQNQQAILTQSTPIIPRAVLGEAYHHHHIHHLNQKSMTRPSSKLSSQYNVENDELHASLMTDLDNYAEIDDIELPDGSQIGFGDEYSSTHNEDNDQKLASSNLDSKFYLVSNTMKFEYLSDSAVSANNECNRQYVCRHCGKRYRWKSTLRRHENVECGGKEPMHQCPHCPYKAKQRGNLGVHIRKHHSSMPPLESRRKINRPSNIIENISNSNIIENISNII